MGYLDQLSDYKLLMKGSVSWNSDDDVNGGGNDDNRPNKCYYLFASVRTFT